MGSDEWDQHTGKYVAVGGLKVSEGDLNLWTSLLIAKKLDKDKNPYTTKRPYFLSYNTIQSGLEAINCR